MRGAAESLHARARVEPLEGRLGRLDVLIDGVLGGGGGKQDEDEDNGKFVSFVPLPTQADIESAILAKRKAELLQVCRVARLLDHWSPHLVRVYACA
jgi:hypothetical protein